MFKKIQPRTDAPYDPSAGIAAHNLSCTYQDQTVFEGVHFSAKPGTITALVGSNGAGKSTLMKCIADLTPYQGELVLNGNRAAYLSQDISAYLAISVFETVLLGLVDELRFKITEDQKERVFEALKELGIEHLAYKMVTQLSGGQRQLVYLAQSIVKDTQVLLLDEPTSALDYKHQFRVLDLIKSLTVNKKLITICAIHDLQLAKSYADQAVCLHKHPGDPVSHCHSGTAAEVLSPDLLYQMLGLHAELLKDAAGDEHLVILPS